MLRGRIRWASSLVVVAVLLVHAVPVHADPRLPFIQNKNQWRRDIRFLASTRGADVLLLNDRIQYVIKEESKEKPIGKHRKRIAYEGGGPHERASWLTRQVYETRFIGGNKSPLIETEDEGKTSYNYFIGDKSHWASNAHGFGSIYYREIYCNTDLKIYSENGRVKQDWVVAPGGDPDEIKIDYEGVESIYLKDGNLSISTHAGDVTELSPVAWQIINNCKVLVPCRYKLKKEVLSFELPQGYDASADLVIDPILIFSGYSGSSFDNWGNSATYDSHGNLYSGGMVAMYDYEQQRDGSIKKVFHGTSWPATPGAYRTQYIGGDWDIGILKYDSSGTGLHYATYVGGNGTEVPQSLFVNNAGELLILGATGSTDFPVTNGTTFKGGVYTDPIDGTIYSGGSDIFIAKISQDGSALIGATYLGGSANDGLNIISGTMSNTNHVQSPLARNYGDEQRGDIITDQDNYVYIASNTRSPDFPVTNTDPNAQFNGGPLDAVLVKLTPNLSNVVYSRLMGGSGSDAAYSLKLDANKGIYIAGGTSSTDFKGMTGLHTANQGDIDGWVAHVSPDGKTIQQATYLGTSAYDQAYFVDLNAASEIFVFGQTMGAYPVTGSVYSNQDGGQFLQKLSSDLSTTIFSTVLGSGGQQPNISPTAFLVSDCNTIFLGGWGGIINADYHGTGVNYVGGSTFGLPITPNAYQSTTGGSDFYFMVLSADASNLLYATYFGGSASFTHVDGGTSRFDKRGIVYQSVCAGCGGQSDFPAVNVPAAHQHNNSWNCNNAAFKFDLSSLRADIQSNSVQLKTPGINHICIGDTIVFQNKSIGGQQFRWNLGDKTLINKNDSSQVQHLYLKTGTYRISLVAIDPGTCLGIDSIAISVIVNPRLGKAGADVTSCKGTVADLTASGGVAYEWTTAGTVNPVSTGAVFPVTPETTTPYFIKITDIYQCVVKDTVTVKVLPGIDVDLSVRLIQDCLNQPYVEVTNLTAAQDSVYIDYGDTTTSTSFSLEQHRYKHDGSYVVQVIGKKGICVYTKQITVPIFTLKIPNVITPEASSGKNDFFHIEYGKGFLEDTSIPVVMNIYNRWGKTVFQSDNYKGQWKGDNVETGIYYYDAIINKEVGCKGWIHVIK